MAVANGPIDVDVVRAGNERVLQARYADASFFFHRDLAQPLEAFRAGLATLTFEERAGSMLDRADRTAQLAGWLADQLGLPETDRATLERAAYLAKADLATEMVVELSTLAGQMGRIYARRQGETPEVADAIFEHTLPRQAGDQLPRSTVGAVLAVADRADALAALFAVGAQPSGSADPYGLRRAASGLIAIVLAHQMPVDLRALFAAAASCQAVAITGAATEELLDFVRRRLEQRLLDEGHRADLVRAVLAAADQPARSVATLAELETLLTEDDFRATATAYRRCLRIAKGTAAAPVDPALFDDPAEVGAVGRLPLGGRILGGGADSGRVRGPFPSPGGTDRRLLRGRHGDGRGPRGAGQPPAPAGATGETGRWVPGLERHRRPVSVAGR